MQANRFSFWIYHYKNEQKHCLLFSIYITHVRVNGLKTNPGEHLVTWIVLFIWHSMYLSVHLKPVTGWYPLVKPTQLGSLSGQGLQDGWEGEHLFWSYSPGKNNQFFFRQYVNEPKQYTPFSCKDIAWHFVNS